MFDRDNTTSKGKNNQVIVIEEMIRQFKKLSKKMTDWMDRQESWIERQDTLFANLRKNNLEKRQDRSLK